MELVSCVLMFVLLTVFIQTYPNQKYSRKIWMNVFMIFLARVFAESNSSYTHIDWYHDGTTIFVLTNRFQLKGKNKLKRNSQVENSPITEQNFPNVFSSIAGGRETLLWLRKSYWRVVIFFSSNSPLGGNNIFFEILPLWEIIFFFKNSPLGRNKNPTKPFMVEIQQSLKQIITIEIQVFSRFGRNN